MERINNKFYVAPSKIQGMGLFASKVIQPMEILFLAFGRADFICLIDNNSFECHFVQLFPNNFVNHSETQANSINSWVDNLYIVKKASRLIMPGEEIVSDYKKGMELIKGKGYSVGDWLKF